MTPLIHAFVLLALLGALKVAPVVDAIEFQVINEE